MIVLRIATNQDLHTVVTWITSKHDCEFWAGHALTYPLHVDTLANDIAFSPENSFCFADEGVQAFGQLIDKGHGRIHLAKIIVNPQRRSAGIGKKFVSALINKAKEKSYSVIGLNVDPKNHVAINLYKKLQFEFAERPVTLGPVPGSLYMQRIFEK